MKFWAVPLVVLGRRVALMNKVHYLRKQPLEEGLPSALDRGEGSPSLSGQPVHRVALGAGGRSAAPGPAGAPRCVGSRGSARNVEFLQ